MGPRQVIFAEAFGKEVSGGSGVAAVDEWSTPGCVLAMQRGASPVRRRWSRHRGSPTSETPAWEAVVGSGLGCGRRIGEGPGSDPSAWRGSLQPVLDGGFGQRARRAGRAGITAGDGPCGPPSHVAPRTTWRSRRRWWAQHLRCGVNGLGSSGGLLADAAGSAGPFVDRGTNGGPGSGNAPGGRVTLIGPATFTGAPGSPSGAVGWRSERGWWRWGFAAACRHQSGRSRRVHHRQRGESATSSVTTLASQIGTSVPAAASTTGAVNNAIATIDQAVSASGA